MTAYKVTMHTFTSIWVDGTFLSKIYKPNTKVTADNIPLSHGYGLTMFRTIEDALVFISNFMVRLEDIYVLPVETPYTWLPHVPWLTKLSSPSEFLAEYAFWVSPHHPDPSLRKWPCGTVMTSSLTVGSPIPISDLRVVCQRLPDTRKEHE